MNYVRHNINPLYFTSLEKLRVSVNETFWQINANNTNIETKALLLAFYKKYITDNHIEIDEYTKAELAVKFYNDTHEYGILTEPLNDPMVEGIHINSWDCVNLKLKNGLLVSSDCFETPSHAIDIMRRIIQSKGGVLDEASPIVETSLGSNIRITTVKTPIVDEHIGVSAYIRKLSPTVFKLEQYTKTDFAMEKEIAMLETFMKRGVSILVVGKVNTGKTTFLSYLLSTLPNDMIIVTIENSAREMDLVKKENGITTNNVIHMLTRESKDENYNINQEDLIITSLRLNPDYISVAEMRDREASSAVEASKSGHPIISTTHAGSPIEAHKRIADLARKNSNTDYKTSLIQAQEAFPIVVFLHTLEDNTRRIMGVTECFVDGENNAHYNPLWKYEIEDNIVENGKKYVVGQHKQVGIFSSHLIEKMKMYGISQKELKQLMKG